MQGRREPKELTNSLDIDWHRPVGNRLDLLGIRAYVTLAHDAPKKWYFASREYTLLEDGNTTYACA